MKSFTKKLKIIWWRIKSYVAMYYYGNPSKKLKIVGVTGTNGKTTTVTLLYQIATALGYKAGLIGTVENIIVKEKRLATHTTPDSISLTKLFAEMLEKGCEYIFMEVSSHALDQGRVAGVHFTGGIFTNLTHDHLDYHKSFKNYFLAKKKFFEMLPKEAFALSNTDDEHGISMLEDISARKFFYSFRPSGVGHPTVLDFKGEIKKLDFNGLELEFNNEKVESKLLGKFNAYNLLSVWSACSLLGFDMEKVKEIFKNIEPPTGRFEHFVSPSGVLVIVDYAHTPDALEKVLLAILEFKSQYSKLISVFGCGGDRDPLKRRIMGKIGAMHSDIAIFTSDNPRNENPESIIEEMKTDLSLELSEKVKSILDRREAIIEAVKIAEKGDIILCAGKGHEMYQEIKGVKHHFNDIEEFQKVFKTM
ncbi:MAG: UDP-N-acetylmuramoyl-L-alanyl-D-glutamate-2,6-diaminopimelate ligase [Candidatus Nomurabacteria bacterium GW2011_GWA2_40_9]|uniref:UDP-N-acetylmuramoyl-L-alanyl-D-glutamate--2,6-diaminopimelate ligase n=1 Tax=Candidatus Nomurabacteria bacterium GW2011_GWA2_40_9 TaxID=1618734 RepID=A0A0G0TQU1_9BACT|nr:MAG: UDP-N-acetylmuramoyl-L-alanyl-D-glutamate-2,6-diaminopimelate ligase [Candidatus Nomurabacteria bacterium GW2011_GWA2_40_9]